MNDAERMGAAELARLLIETAEAGGYAAGATVVGSSEPRLVGSRLALLRTRNPETQKPELTTRGSLGSADLDARTTAHLEQLLDDARSRDGIHRMEAEADRHEVFVEIRRPLRELLVVGAGHIAQPMAHLGAMLGYRVTVLDDRPDFATRERFPDADRLVRADFSDPFADVELHERSHLLLVTRGHKYDYECLIRALRSDPPPAYIGMIGSRRRVRATYVQLLDEGLGREALDKIHAPVGLDIGAETPEEIAVAVAAELVMLDRGGTGTPLRDVERIMERFFPDEGEADSPPGGAR